MTQKEHFWKSHRKMMDRLEGFNWLMRQDNKPTKEELEKLRKKNPKIWNSYPG